MKGFAHVKKLDFCQKDIQKETTRLTYTQFLSVSRRVHVMAANRLLYNSTEPFLQENVVSTVYPLAHLFFDQDQATKLEGR